MPDNRYLALKKIRDEILSLESSPLYAYRQENHYFPVIGEGSHSAQIMFIGEAPGKNEAQTGKPFCGAAGRVLDELLKSAGIKRQDVYITNIVKDRPPGNRDPLPAEIDLYAPFLVQQIEIIQPNIIATLGRFSMVYIMEKYGLTDKLKPISQLHGQTFTTNASYGQIKIVPLYHPAATIYKASLKQDLIKDLQALTE